MANVYNRAKFRLLKGDMDFDLGGNLAVRCLLLKSGVAFNPDHNVVNDLTPGTNEISVGGYLRQTVGGVAVSQVDGSDWGAVQGNQVTFSALASGQTIGAAVLFLRLGASDADATDPLIAYYDLTDTPTNGGDVTVRFGGASPGDFLRLTE